MHNKISSMPRERMHREKGVVTLLFAVALPVLLGAAAFAIDMAHLYVVRNELQNDADAAALAGARYLYKDASSPLDWDLATQKTQQAVALNRAQGQMLRDGTVQTGYWNLSGSAMGLQALPWVPTVNDAPAVQVSVSRSEGQNQGPVGTFMARIWGLRSVPIRVTAIAGVASPGSFSPGGLFPFAMSQCMYDQYWNSGVQPAGPRIDPLTGKPFEFRVGTLYRYAQCESGEWTSLDSKASGADAIDGMITTGNPVTLAIGDAIWVQSGVKNSLFQAVQKCSAAGDKSCEYVNIPVLNRVTAGSFATITAFACLHIQKAVGGNDKYIQVQMSTQCKAPYSEGVGPNYGVVSPPSLFR